MSTRNARRPVAVRLTSLRLTSILLAATLALLAGCRDVATGPRVPGRQSTHDAPAPMAAEELASTAWGEITQQLVIRYRPSPPAAFRQFAYLSVAQYAAAVSAEEAGDGPRPSTRGAVAGASAVVLGYLFPLEQQALDSIVREQARVAGDPVAFTAGVAVGRAEAKQLLVRAWRDGFDAVYSGPIPRGPGLWFSSTNPPTAPLLPLLGRMRPLVLATGRQFRPPPPPEFGSPEYLDALAEVREIARTRTPEQVRIAQFWALPAGTVLPAGYFNQVAAQIVTREGLGERAAARVFALMHAAMLDAVIGSHDAKYEYWFIRPTQADPTITLAIGLPNHPSYPSNHSAACVAASTILGALFPADRERLEAMAAEAGLSRLYGGVHYRFDMDAAGVMARAVAGEVLAADRRGDFLTLVR